MASPPIFFPSYYSTNFRIASATPASSFEPVCSNPLSFNSSDAFAKKPPGDSSLERLAPVSREGRRHCARAMIWHIPGAGKGLKSRGWDQVRAISPAVNGGRSPRRGDSDSPLRLPFLRDFRIRLQRLGNEARDEITKITAAMRRIDTGDYGICTSCGVAIEAGRIEAYPYADQCIDCARLGETRRARCSTSGRRGNTKTSSTTRLGSGCRRS